MTKQQPAPQIHQQIHELLTEAGFSHGAIGRDCRHVYNHDDGRMVVINPNTGWWSYSGALTQTGTGWSGPAPRYGSGYEELAELVAPSAPATPKATSTEAGAGSCGNGTWKQVSSRAYQRRLDLGPVTVIGRVSAVDAKQAKWNAVVLLRLAARRRPGSTKWSRRPRTESTPATGCWRCSRERRNDRSAFDSGRRVLR
jgi:hypothetical protein